MLLTTHIQFAYNSQMEFKFPDLAVQKGEHLLILGNSGKGKTTLLHLLAGFLKIHSGSICIGDTKLEKLNGFERDLFRAQNIGVIFQVPHFIASLSLMQNILWAQKLARKRPNNKEVLELMERLNLAHRANSTIGQLSQGELQRASIIRGIINHPVLVLADEPTSSLDDDNCQKVIQLLEEQTDNVGAALVVVTHDQRLKDFFNNTIQL